MLDTHLLSVTIYGVYMYQFQLMIRIATTVCVGVHCLSCSLCFFLTTFSRSKTLLSAAAHGGCSSNVTKVLSSSATMLTRYVEMILNAIFDSAKQCPSVLRVVLRQLWLRTETQFKQPEHYVSVHMCLCLHGCVHV